MAEGFGGRGISFVSLFKEDISYMRGSMEEGVKLVVRKVYWFWLNQYWANKDVRLYEGGKAGDFPVPLSWNIFIGVDLRQLYQGLSGSSTSLREAFPSVMSGCCGLCSVCL